ncbi:hypothetical protein H5410_035043, partial [Solanum commersonii]
MWLRNASNPPFELKRTIQYCSPSNIDSVHKTGLNFTWFMARRSIWKDSFVDAFLLTMKNKKNVLFNRDSFVDAFLLTMKKKKN